jgi:hypothetical protein
VGIEWIKGPVRSDHLVVVVSPGHVTKPGRKDVYFRDVSDRKFSMTRKLETWDRNQIHDCNNANDAVTLFNDTTTNLFNEGFPLKREYSPVCACAHRSLLP